MPEVYERERASRHTYAFGLPAVRYGVIDEIDPTEASRRVSAGALLVDVREADEFAQARIPGAMLVPLSAFAARIDELPRDREVVLMCAAGVRSLNAAAFAAQRGYRVSNLAGGIQAWHQEGLPVELGSTEGATT